MKRLVFLDALRGFMTLFMVPHHAVLTALAVMGFSEAAGQEFVVEFGTPAATGLAIFFFITGMSLAISLAQRREQPLTKVAAHVIVRYSGYMVVGAVYGPLLLHIMDNKYASHFLSLFYGSFHTQEAILNLVDPIASLGLTAIIAFPIIFHLSWKPLAVTSFAAAFLMSLMLSLPQAASLQVFPLRIFFTNPWAVLKTLPLMLSGATAAKLVLTRQRLSLPLFLSGLSLTLPYLVVLPLSLSGSMLFFFFAMWTYYHALLYILGASLAALGLVLMLEARNTNLSPLTVLGRSSFLVFYLHITIELVLTIQFAEHLSTMLVAGMTFGVTAAMWIVGYLYSTWRWGSPTTWYETADNHKYTGLR